MLVRFDKGDVRISDAAYIAYLQLANRQQELEPEMLAHKACATDWQPTCAVSSKGTFTSLVLTSSCAYAIYSRLSLDYSSILLLAGKALIALARAWRCVDLHKVLTA